MVNALVRGKVLDDLAGRLGQGFFDTVSSLRHKTILKAEQELVWLAEVSARTAHFGQSIR